MHSKSTPLPRQRRPRPARRALRPLKERDTDAVVELIALAMNSDEAGQARETLQFHFACQRNHLDDGRSYYVLDDGKAIAGVVGLHHYVWGPAENVWLAWFAVQPELRGTGVGKHLLAEIAALARRRGYTRLLIETYSTPEFSDARTFYSANGFGFAGLVRSYLPNGGDMVVFSKDLTSNV